MYLALSHEKSQLLLVFMKSTIRILFKIETMRKNIFNIFHNLKYRFKTCDNTDYIKNLVIYLASSISKIISIY